MNEQLKKVREWQEIFGRDGHTVSDVPRTISSKLANHRIRFLLEEITEYLDANEEENIVEILDALCDIQYFLFGMVIIHGLQDKFGRAFEIVHDSNMSKLDKNGQPIIRESDGKVLKGENFWRPTEKLKELLYESSQNISEVVGEVKIISSEEAEEFINT